MFAVSFSDKKSKKNSLWKKQFTDEIRLLVGFTRKNHGIGFIWQDNMKNYGREIFPCISNPRNWTRTNIQSEIEQLTTWLSDWRGVNFKVIVISRARDFGALNQRNPGGARFSNLAQSFSLGALRWRNFGAIVSFSNCQGERRNNCSFFLTSSRTFINSTLTYRWSMRFCVIFVYPTCLWHIDFKCVLIIRKLILHVYILHIYSRSKICLTRHPWSRKTPKLRARSVSHFARTFPSLFPAWKLHF